MGAGLVTSIFPAKEMRGSNSSYLSENKLLWRNDGWSNNASPYVMLLGLVGKKEIRTNAVDARDIITHFRKSGKQNYLVGAEEPTSQTNNSQVDKFLVKKSPVVGIKFGSKNSLAF
jgi:hypothetical protein